MRLRHIEVFNAVMLTGSVSGAARLINVTQPAVSRTLAHAELQLGFSLFQRTRNRLVATREALALYPHVEQLFANLDEVQRMAETLKAGQDDKEISVLSIPALGHEVLPRAMKIFHDRRPQVRVVFRALHSPQIVSSLALQEADVGFLLSPATHPALQHEVIGQAQFICIAPKGVLGARILKRGVVTLRELAGQPVIGLETTDPMGNTLNQACREAGVGLASRITVQSYHAALALARHGLGIALVDGCTALSADATQVDLVRLEPPIPVAVHALWPSAKPSSVAVRAFTQAVQRVLADQLGPVTQPAAPASPAVPSRKRA